MNTFLDRLLRELIKEFGYQIVAKHLAALKTSSPLGEEEKRAIEIAVARTNPTFSRLAALREIRNKWNLSLDEAKAILDVTWPQLPAITFRDIPF